MGWNGYANSKDDRYTQDPRYRGSVPEMMKLLQQFAVPDTMLTMCMGPDASWDSLTEIEIDGPQPCRARLTLPAARLRITVAPNEDGRR